MEKSKPGLEFIRQCVMCSRLEHKPTYKMWVNIPVFCQRCREERENKKLKEAVDLILSKGGKIKWK